MKCFSFLLILFLNTAGALSQTCETSPKVLKKCNARFQKELIKYQHYLNENEIRIPDTPPVFSKFSLIYPNVTSNGYFMHQIKNYCRQILQDSTTYRSIVSYNVTKLALKVKFDLSTFKSTNLVHYIEIYNALRETWIYTQTPCEGSSPVANLILHDFKKDLNSCVKTPVLETAFVTLYYQNLNYVDTVKYTTEEDAEFVFRHLNNRDTIQPYKIDCEGSKEYNDICKCFLNSKSGKIFMRYIITKIVQCRTIRAFAFSNQWACV